MRSHRRRHRDVPSIERSATLSRWITDLRACCTLLAETSSDTVSGVSLTLPLGDAPDGALAVMRYGDRLACEYGLHTRWALEDGTLTLWLARGHNALSPAQRGGAR
uniref:Uncharacterized protein n=1 Tax=Thermorudis peleae TaxID=1382356 RepID=A0A831TBI9_9BACT